MTIFDLLLLLVFLTCAAALVSAGWNALRGRGPAAVRTLQRLGAFLLAYLGIVIVVALASPRRIIPAGTNQCADDWCIAVLRSERWPSKSAKWLAVTLRVSSRALRVPQSAPDARVYLLDSDGHAYEPDAPAQAAYERANGPAIPFSVRLQPGEAILTTRVFETPRPVDNLRLRLVHGGWPELFVIGDSNSLFHKRTVMRLD